MCMCIWYFSYGVLMYVCACALQYVPDYTHAFECNNVRAGLYTWVWRTIGLWVVCVRIYIYIYIYIYLYIYICVCVAVCVCMCVYVCVYKWGKNNENIYIYIYIYIYMCVCMGVGVCVYKWGKNNGHVYAWCKLLILCLMSRHCHSRLREDIINTRLYPPHNFLLLCETFQVPEKKWCCLSTFLTENSEKSLFYSVVRLLWCKVFFAFKSYWRQTFRLGEKNSQAIISSLNRLFDWVSQVNIFGKDIREMK